MMAPAITAPPMMPAATPGPHPGRLHPHPGPLHPHPGPRHWAETSIVVAAKVAAIVVPMTKGLYPDSFLKIKAERDSP